jgi:branched-chain amino acid transport system ATP-binding protein
MGAIMAEVALRTVALARRFGGLTAVNDVSLDFHLGEIHAVIGPNGAGKTTLVNLLSGDLEPTSGDVFLGDRCITTLGADKRGLSGIGRSYQKTTIFSDATMFENVRLAVQAHSARPLALMKSGNAEHEQRARTAAALDRVGLRGRANVRAGVLSHGEQRQLEIAMVIATDPKVVLLDEPLAGMGQSESRTMVELIRTLRAGRAVLLVEHDMDAVFAVADRLTVMADGRVIATGAPADVRLHPAVRAAYLGAETLHT